MTLADLITYFREEADDKRVPYLWTDTLLTFYANEAQEEACRRARLIKDTTTAGVCVYNATVGMQVLTVDPRVIFIRRVTIASKTIPLAKIRATDLDFHVPGWESEVPGDVTHYCTDRDVGKIWFHQPFSAVDTITLQVVRGPLRQMALKAPGQDQVDPEIAPRYQPKLVHWMLHRAFMKQDSEANDPDKSKNALTNFELEFGAPSPARDEMWITERQGYDDFEGDY